MLRTCKTENNVLTLNYLNKLLFLSLTMICRIDLILNLLMKKDANFNCRLSFNDFFFGTFETLKIDHSASFVKIKRN